MPASESTLRGKNLDPPLKDSTPNNCKQTAFLEPLFILISYFVQNNQLNQRHEILHTSITVFIVLNPVKLCLGFQSKTKC